MLLYVEDEIIVSMVVLMALEDAGFEVLHMLDGRAGVEALESRPENLQALVTDVRLPEIDGWEIARRARELNPDLPVIYVTGDSGADWRFEGVSGSVLLQKPFANSKLVATLNRLLD